MENGKVSSSATTDVKSCDPVKITDEYLSQSCIEQCIKRFEEIKNDPNPVLEIITTKTIKEVDPLLIAYFVLFKKEKSELNIILNLNYNDFDKEDKGKGVVFRTMQYGTHAIITSHLDNLFTLIYSSGKKFDAKSDITESQFVWSEHFIPVTFIDKENFKKLFVTDSHFIFNFHETVYDINNNKLYENIRKTLHSSINKEPDKILALTKLAFLESLEKAKILSFYLYKDFHDNQEITKEVFIKETYHIGSLQNEKALQFYKAVQETLIFNELSKRPPIYNFIYATLLSSELLPGKLTSKNSKDFINALKNLWIFTQQLVDGIEELAKNIYQHSSNYRGVITGRVYSSSKLTEMQNILPTNEKLIETYLYSLKKLDKQVAEYFFEINVIDDGEKGVIQKLKEYLDIRNKTQEEKEDWEEISKGLIKFNNLLNPNDKLLLNQQTKRATAHLGLLIFSKLIEENKGLIRAGTWELNDNKKRDPVLWFPLIEEYEKKKISAQLCSIGTNYHFLLPLNPNEPIKPTIPIKYEIPIESTMEEMKNIEDLFNYYVKDYYSGQRYDPKLEYGKNYLFITNSNQNLITASKPEEFDFWKEIIAPFSNKHTELIKNSNPREKSFVCLNLNKSEINVSQLFRLLGRWELEFPGCPLLVFNISIELFFKLTEINKHYYNKLKKNYEIPYWNIDSLILFYCYKEIENGKFYFTDALWGAEQKDYLFVNQLIDKTNFNASISLVKTKNPDNIAYEEVINSNKNLILRNKSLLARFGLFQNGITLLPFDLLLNSSEGLTLFEHNAAVLLQNELKPEREA